MARRIGRIASQAHGVVTRQELLAAGVSEDAIRARLRSGALLSRYPGIYRVGHAAPSVEAGYTAAVKACGESAVLGGLAAAWAWGLLRGRAAPRPEVIAPTVRRVEGVTTHRARGIDPRETTAWKAIPITTVPRTLVDLAAVLSFDDLARACHEAGVRYRTTPAQVEAVLSRCPNRPGAGTLKRVLRGEARVTLSRLEEKFLCLLREAKLSLPQTNRPAGSRRVDCRWPERRLTVELDSYRYHSSRHAWEQDRRREREARARGDEFRRYTYGDVVEDSRFILEELRLLLTRSAASGSPPGPGTSPSSRP